MRPRAFSLFVPFSMLSFAGQRLMRAAALISISVAVAGGGVAVAQSQREPPDSAEDSPRQETSDEVIVTGKRLAELRLEVRGAREHAYDIFNEINSSNDFDVHCGEQTRTFSHAKVWVCRAQFEKRIEAEAAKAYLDGLTLSCRGEGGVTQGCMFSGNGDRAIARVEGVKSPLLGKRQQLNEEIVKLANQDARFAQAIIDFFIANQNYAAARKSRDDD